MLRCRTSGAALSVERLEALCPAADRSGTASYARNRFPVPAAGIAGQTRRSMRRRARKSFSQWRLTASHPFADLPVRKLHHSALNAVSTLCERHATRSTSSLPSPIFPSLFIPLPALAPAKSHLLLPAAELFVRSQSGSNGRKAGDDRCVFHPVRLLLKIRSCPCGDGGAKRVQTGKPT